jgi:hypothetical protein
MRIVDLQIKILFSCCTWLAEACSTSLQLLDNSNTPDLDSSKNTRSAETNFLFRSQLCWRRLARLVLDSSKNTRLIGARTVDLQSQVTTPDLWGSCGGVRGREKSGVQRWPEKGGIGRRLPGKPPDACGTQAGVVGKYFRDGRMRGISGGGQMRIFFEWLARMWRTISAPQFWR